MQFSHVIMPDLQTLKNSQEHFADFFTKQSGTKNPNAEQRQSHVYRKNYIESQTIMRVDP